MRDTISYAAVLTALGLTVAAGPTNAQTIISGQPVETVITQQPVQTVQTTETVRTVRPGARPIVRKRVVTTTRQTVVSQRTVTPQPLYDVVPPAPLATRTYAPPLYDTVAPAPTVDDTYVNALPPAGAAIPVYRYVYEPDRILVVDPATNIAIQAIPR
ncbi:MAG TPA: hypothetical protein VK337_15915 [Xanthobacteraceae bacterium]|nr:hypothetical protein [Xanthobacteraceae bacterium]